MGIYILPIIAVIEIAWAAVTDDMRFTLIAWVTMFIFGILGICQLIASVTPMMK